MRALTVALLLAGCANLPPPQPWTSVGPSRVLEILTRHQCVACHSVESVFGSASRADAEPPARALPTLASMNRFRASWLRSFLQSPFIVRPNLPVRMIPHALTPAELDALLVGWSAAPDEPEPPPPSAATFARGAALFETRQCGGCHSFGAVPLQPVAVGPDPRLRALAPDLQHTRLRLTRATLERFLLTPAEVKPTTQMPIAALTPDEANALSSFLYFTSLPSPPG